MRDFTTGNKVIDFILGLGAVVALLWGGTKYMLQPAFKIAQAEERARQYKETADSYKARVDALVKTNEQLTMQIAAQSKLVDEVVKRTDMALLYIAERMAWERRGRVDAPPVLPEALESALYDIVATRIHPDREVPEDSPPFPDGGSEPHDERPA